MTIFICSAYCYNDIKVLVMNLSTSLLFHLSNFTSNEIRFDLNLACIDNYKHLFGLCCILNFYFNFMYCKNGN